jgi:hypothetical protein
MPRCARRAVLACRGGLRRRAAVPAVQSAVAGSARRAPWAPRGSARLAHAAFELRAAAPWRSRPRPRPSTSWSRTRRAARSTSRSRSPRASRRWAAEGCPAAPARRGRLERGSGASAGGSAASAPSRRRCSTLTARRSRSNPTPSSSCSMARACRRRTRPRRWGPGRGAAAERAVCVIGRLWASAGPARAAARRRRLVRQPAAERTLCRPPPARPPAAPAARHGGRRHAGLLHRAGRRLLGCDDGAGAQPRPAPAGRGGGAGAAARGGDLIPRAIALALLHHACFRPSGSCFLCACRHLGTQHAVVCLTEQPCSSCAGLELLLLLMMLLMLLLLLMLLMLLERGAAAAAWCRAGLVRRGFSARPRFVCRVGCQAASIRAVLLGQVTASRSLAWSIRALSLGRFTPATT